MKVEFETFEEEALFWVKGAVNFSILLFVAWLYVLLESFFGENKNIIFVKTTFMLIAYIGSIYLLSYSIKKKLKVKIAAWSFSIVFHLGLIAYIYKTVEVVNNNLWLMSAEFFISGISLLALTSVVTNREQESEA